MSGGGSIDQFRITAFAPESEQAVRERFNSERDAEYTEVVERAVALVAELDRESERERFTFAEVEENEAELVKLRRWLKVIAGRDRYGAAGRARAEAAVEEAARRLREFTERSVSEDGAR